MVTMALLSGAPTLLKNASPLSSRINRSSSLVPSSRRSVAVCAEKKPSWLLEKPNRLWELDTTWYPGADPPSYLDGSLRECHQLLAPNPFRIRHIVKDFFCLTTLSCALLGLMKCS